MFWKKLTKEIVCTFPHVCCEYPAIYNLKYINKHNIQSPFRSYQRKRIKISSHDTHKSEAKIWTHSQRVDKLPQFIVTLAVAINRAPCLWAMAIVRISSMKRQKSSLPLTCAHRWSHSTRTHICCQLIQRNKKVPYQLLSARRSSHASRLRRRRAVAAFDMDWWKRIFIPLKLYRRRCRPSSSPAGPTRLNADKWYSTIEKLNRIERPGRRLSSVIRPSVDCPTLATNCVYHL